MKISNETKKIAFINGEDLAELNAKLAKSFELKKLKKSENSASKLSSFDCIIVYMAKKTQSKIIKKLIHESKTKPILLVFQEKLDIQDLRYMRDGIAEIISLEEIMHVDLYIYLQKLMNRWRDQRRIKAELLRAQTNLLRKNKFISILAHEVKNPVSAIVGAISLVENESLDHESRDQCFDIISKSSKNLNQLLSEMLELSISETGLVSLNISSVSIKNLVQDLVSSMSYLAKQKKLFLILDLDEKIPDLIRLDQSKLSQVLINIISNGIKYTLKGFVKVKVSYDYLKSNLIIVVEDSGLGMTKKEIKSLFRLYGRTDSALNSNIKGTGVGLAVCRNLLKSMKGNISLESQPGNGSTFTITVPAEEPKEHKLEPKPSTDIQYNLHILVVDDDAINLLLLEKILKPIAVNIDLAGSGEEAWKLLQVNIYDVIITDYNLKDTYGSELGRKIRKSEVPSKQAVLVCLSATVDEETRERCLEAGMDSMLEKPLKIKKIKELMLLQKEHSVA